MNEERVPWIFREPEERPTNEERVPWLFRGGALENLVLKYKPVAIVVYVSTGSILLSIFLYLLTGFAIFIWLRNVALAVYFAIFVASIIINVKDYLRERKAQEQKRQASR